MTYSNSEQRTQKPTVLKRWLPVVFGVLFALSSLNPGHAGPAAVAPTANLTAGCLERYDSEIDYFPDKATLIHAQGFTLEYFQHYKVVTVTTPWPNARESFRYLLVQCGAPVPEGFTDAQVIQIPVRSIAVLSTTHLPHLERLDALDRLVAVSARDSVYSPTVREKIAAGAITEIGRGPSLNLEALLDLGPDLVTAVGHDQPQYNTHPLLQRAGVNVAINAEYVEPTLLGRSEWLKFTAAFLNLDGRAEREFAGMVERYEAYAAQVRDIPTAQKPSVFGGFLQRDVWYVPGGDSYSGPMRFVEILLLGQEEVARSAGVVRNGDSTNRLGALYIARLVADAGGRYLWADDARQASIPLSFEAVFARAREAEVWFTSGLDWFTRADLHAANEHYGAFRAFREGRVYNINARLNEQKANDYWEMGILEPEILLADVIRILHPERLPEHRLKYYRRLP